MIVVPRVPAELDVTLNLSRRQYQNLLQVRRQVHVSELRLDFSAAIEKALQTLRSDPSFPEFLLERTFGETPFRLSNAH